MFKFLRFVITVFIFALLASCANENKDNLLLDAEEYQIVQIIMKITK